MDLSSCVTIVLPVYNGERYLQMSIESVLNQSYSNIELIIVDDCSTDNTGDIIREYADRDSRVRFISNSENGGLPYSLNRGFDLASGSYLTWTSDDNMFHKEAITKMVSYLDMHSECGLVFADMNLIDENGAVIGHRIGNNYNIYNRNCVGACFMYRSECRRNIGDYDENKGLIEDYDYWLRIASKYKIDRIPEILYDYRYHDNSLTVKKIRSVGERLADLRLEYIDKIAVNVDEDSFREILFEMIICGGEQVASSIAYLNLIDTDIVFNRRKRITDDSIWLFGAGGLGRSAITILGDKTINGFIDNDPNKIGGIVSGITVFSFDQFREMKSKDTVVISTELRYAYSIMKQLYSYGVDNVVLLYDLTLE